MLLSCVVVPSAASLPQAGLCTAHRLVSCGPRDCPAFVFCYASDAAANCVVHEGPLVCFSAFRVLQLVVIDD